MKKIQRSQTGRMGAAIFALFFGIFILGAFMQAQAVEYLEIKDTRIPVIFEQSKLVPKGFIRLTFIGGGNINDNQKVGLAWLGSKLLNEGTKTQGVIAFYQQLEKNAISLSAQRGTETLSIEVDFLKQKQEEAIQALGDLLSHPNLTPSTLAKIKQEAINTLLSKQNDFDYLASNGLSKLIFRQTPLAQIPTKESLESITLEDLQNYIKQNLVLARLVIILGGDMDKNATLQVLRPLIAQLGIGERAPKHHYEASGAREESSLYKNDTDQAYIYFGAPFKLNDLKEEAYKAKILSFVLGSSGFGSRLMEEIRVKRALAYSAYMKIHTGKIVNYASGHLQTKLENQDKAIALVREVVANFVKNGITQDELDAAKKFLLGSEPLRTETLSQRLDSQFLNYYLGLPLDFNQTQLSQIESISLAEINAYIQSHTELNNLSFSILSAPKKSSVAKKSTSAKGKK